MVDIHVGSLLVRTSEGRSPPETRASGFWLSQSTLMLREVIPVDDVDSLVVDDPESSTPRIPIRLIKEVDVWVASARCAVAETLLRLILTGELDVDLPPNRTTLPSSSFTLNASLPRSIGSSTHSSKDTRWPFPKMTLCWAAFCMSLSFSSLRLVRVHVKLGCSGRCMGSLIRERSSAMVGDYDSNG